MNLNTVNIETLQNRIKDLEEKIELLEEIIPFYQNQLTEKTFTPFFEINPNVIPKDDKQDFRKSLYRALVDNNYIRSTEIKEGEFISIFTKKISKNQRKKVKIKWHGNVNTCVYLFERLSDHTPKKNVISSAKIYKKVEEIFNIKNPNQIKSGYQKNKKRKPKGGKAIDEIVDRLLDKYTLYYNTV